MKKFLIAMAFGAALASPAWAQKAEAERAPDPIVQFSDQDAAMNAAIADARRSYPQFLTQFNAAPPREASQSYMLKLGLPTPDGGHEHIWVSNLRRERGQLVGDLANEPAGLPGRHLGSRVEVDDALVSDWAIITNDGMYGSFTTRVMLPFIDPSEAASLREMLTPQPLPAGWSH